MKHTENIPTFFEQEANRMAALNKYKHMNSDDKSGATTLLTIIGAGVLIAFLWLYSIFAYGFVAVKLWAWFVVPVFHTTVTFGILQAAGLLMFVRFFVQEHKMPVTDPDETTSQKICKVILPIIVPWMVLLLGWLLKSMM
jgi:hypothetical protein